MSLLQRACKTLGGLGIVVALPTFVFGQSTNSTSSYAPSGGEYAPAGNLPGDQTYPAIALAGSKGYMVWQDNVTDGDGLGISAIQLNTGFAAFRVNSNGVADQENPQVAMLSNGGAVFVWQGGVQSFQHIYARFISAAGIFTTSDIMVNTATNVYQSNPQVAVLANGNVVVTWSSYGQDNADGMQGIYAQILSPSGQKVNSEFAVNQFTLNNQRSPAIASFKNGNFVIAWVSELQRSTQLVGGDGTSTGGHNSVDIYARIFNSSGAPVTNALDTLINTDTNVCANPSVATASDGSYIIAWSQKNALVPNNSWDVWARAFSTNGVGGAAQVINSQLYGDQYAPVIKSLGANYLAVWTSLGQDGSQQGVYSQFLNADASHNGVEQRVNTTVLGPQEFPAVASDGQSRFLVGWAGLNQANVTFDLYAQSFAPSSQVVATPAAPFVKALDSYSLSVSWPPYVGATFAHYELFVDGSTAGINLTNNMWANLNYVPSATHTFQLAYAFIDGTQSPLSAVASGTTWGRDGNHDGLPDDWQTLYWGSNSANWPAPNTKLASGVTVLQTFLWGSNPLDPTTYLKQTVTQTGEGVFLNWNTVPGGIYQVMVSADLKTWTQLGSPRFAAGATDSLYLGAASKSYYQIVRNLY